MRKKLVSAVIAALAAGVGVLVSASPAPAGVDNVDMSVVKVVEGPEPAGATYAIEVNCVGGGSGTVNFPAGGGVEVISFFSGGFEGDCTFTETTTSGATPSYACVVDQQGSGTCGGGGASPVTLAVNDPSPGQLATITITNTYAAAATAVEAEPTTTG